MNELPAHCCFCKAPLPADPGPRRGRPREYCDTGCRQAAHRDRRKTAASPAASADEASYLPPTTLRTAHPPSAPGAPGGPPSQEDPLMEIVKDMQEELRQLLRSMSASEATPQDALRRVVNMRAQLEGLTAGLVGRARERRVTWTTIGDILGTGGDTARHRFTQAHISRRVGQLVRPRAGQQPPPASARPRSAQARPAKKPPPVGPAPSEPSRASHNRLAPVLSMLARGCDTSLQAIAKKSGCSPSYLSRILSGDRVPTWSLTERFAAACGADPAVLRPAWETERLKEKTPKSPARPAPADSGPAPGADALLAALRALHARAGSPSAYEMAVASQWRMTPDQVTEMLDGGALDEWRHLSRILFILGGDHGYFRPLWEAAATTADQLQPPETEEPPEPPLPPVGEDVSERVPTLLKHFSSVLGSRPDLSPRQERLLKAKQKAVLASLAERIDGHTGPPAKR